MREWGICFSKNVPSHTGQSRRTPDIGSGITSFYLPTVFASNSLIPRNVFAGSACSEGKKQAENSRFHGPYRIFGCSSHTLEHGSISSVCV